jgi:hypothetical protein
VTDSIKCPICGAETTLRTAKKGPAAGKQFFVCLRYPQCKGRLKYQTSLNKTGLIYHVPKKDFHKEKPAIADSYSHKRQTNIHLNICQNCGRWSQTRYVAFYRNIGMLIMRQTTSIRGHFCKECSHHYFWSYTAITFAVGWLGAQSLIIAPFFILNNFFRYLTTLRMESPDNL